MAACARGGRLVVATMASAFPQWQWARYCEAFERLGVADLAHLRLVNGRLAPDALAVLRRARAVFFTGGDQCQLAASVLGTPVERRLRRLWAQGAAMAGTSAGAAAMSEVMLTAEQHDQERWSLGRGLGFLTGLLIDQHFTERRRLPRLAEAIRLRPDLVGVGIDEDTALVVQERGFRVIGRGRVYVVHSRRTRTRRATEGLTGR